MFHRLDISPGSEEVRYCSCGSFLTCRAYVPINASALAILSIAERVDRGTVTGQGAIWAKFIRAAVQVTLGASFSRRTQAVPSDWITWCTSFTVTQLLASLAVPPLLAACLTAVFVEASRTQTLTGHWVTSCAILTITQLLTTKSMETWRAGVLA